MTGKVSVAKGVSLVAGGTPGSVTPTGSSVAAPTSGCDTVSLDVPMVVSVAAPTSGRDTVSSVTVSLGVPSAVGV